MNKYYIAFSLTTVENSFYTFLNKLMMLKYCTIKNIRYCLGKRNFSTKERFKKRQTYQEIKNLQR